MKNTSSQSSTLVGIGAGGHARVMIHAARLCGWNVRLLVDRPNSDGESQLDGVPIQYVDDVEFLADLVRQNSRDPVAVFIGATGRGSARADAYRRIVAAGIESPNLIDPNAIVESNAQIGNGVHILAGAIVGAGGRIGNDVLLNHRSVVEHDCVVADHVHVATGAVLCGGVEIETNCMIGAGAVVLPGVHVAAGSVIGAGAVVTTDVPAGTVVVGNPARPMSRRSTSDRRTNVRESASPLSSPVS